MRTIFVWGLLAAGAAVPLFPQGRPLDWPFLAGDAQRTGWQKSDWRITKENVKDFQLVMKRKLENKGKGPWSLTPPVVIGNLISYRGFKELAFVAGSSDTVWSIDADLDRVFWQKQLETAGKPKAGGSAFCSSAVAANPSLTPPANFARRSPGVPPSPAGAPASPPARGFLGAGGFGSPRPAFVLASDGKLHFMNTSNGSDVAPPVAFLPPGAKASSLVLADGVMYTSTSGGCAGVPDAIWAIDLNAGDAVSSFPLKGGGTSALGGFSMGADGTVFAQTAGGAFDADAGQWGGALLALSPRDLKMKAYFRPSDAAGKTSGQRLNVATPVVFTYKEKELVVTVGQDGRLVLLDGMAPGGADHRTALYQTAPVAAVGGGVWGGLSSWQDTAGARWVLAPVWGGVNAELKASGGNGAAPNGSIVAFKLEEQGGKPALSPAWVSRDMNSPEPPVITSGTVFALAAGAYGKGEQPKGHATLFALDGETGKEIYSTGNQVSSAANLTGISIANSRVYFTTVDNLLYAFGLFLER